MTYTDSQLKQALAKMLPDTVFIDGGKNLTWKEGARYVRDTELLHLCWLVEQTLGDLWPDYYAQFVEFVGIAINASWQQRVIALAKVKGVEIV